MSKEDRHWQQTQRVLFEKGLLLQRNSLGLQLRDGGTDEPLVELSPDLRRATLLYEQEYLANSSPYQGDTVRLLHTAAYQKQGDRWLKTSMNDLYWGEWQKTDGDFLTIEYPERDASVVERIGRDLNAQLRDICQNSHREDGVSLDCTSFKPFILVMSTDNASMETFSRPDVNLSNGKTVLLPTPSLIGLPIDENGYKLIYQGYAQNIVNQFEAMLNVPLPFPEEAIYTLCFDFPNEGLKLMRYDLQRDAWTAELSDRSFYSLRALPDNGGLVLQETPPSDAENRLRLTQLRGGKESILLDDFGVDHSYRPIGWAISDFEPRLLFQSSYRDQSEVDYGWIGTASCAEKKCEILELPGYASWATDGEHTLLVNGSRVSTGDHLGQEGELVGPGFNPFWIDRETYGFIRFNAGPLGILSELVIGRLFEDKQSVLLDSNFLGQTTGIGSGEDIFIQYVSISPANPQLLILSASGVRELSGEFFIFTYLLPEESENGTDGEINLLLRHRGAPGGTPASLTPTGFPPIDISPDGRWLLVSDLDSDSKSTWSFFLLGLGQNHARRLTDSFPILPAQFPYYDWSKDGQWLVIADQGFFVL